MTKIEIIIVSGFLPNSQRNKINSIMRRKDVYAPYIGDLELSDEDRKVVLMSTLAQKQIDLKNRLKVVEAMIDGLKDESLSLYSEGWDYCSAHVVCAVKNGIFDIKPIPSFVSEEKNDSSTEDQVMCDKEVDDNNNPILNMRIELDGQMALELLSMEKDKLNKQLEETINKLKNL